MRSSATHSERERFVADLVRHAPAADSVIAGRLMRYAGAYHRLAARNGDLTFAERRKYERIIVKIHKLSNDIRCRAVFIMQGFNIVAPDDWVIGVPRI